MQSPPTLLTAPLYQAIAILVLALALFVPVRRLIWVIAVRREEARLGRPTEAARRQRLRQRASWLAAVVSALFSLLYVHATAGRLLGHLAP